MQNAKSQMLVDDYDSYVQALLVMVVDLQSCTDVSKAGFQSVGSAALTF